MTWCEANDVEYVLGLAGNSRLVRKLAHEMRKAKLRAKRTAKPARAFADFPYRTRKSRSAKRRVVDKAEWSRGAAVPLAERAREPHTARPCMETNAIRSQLTGTEDLIRSNVAFCPESAARYGVIWRV
jgi:hypothetical protein